MTDGPIAEANPSVDTLSRAERARLRAAADDDPLETRRRRLLLVPLAMAVSGLLGGVFFFMKSSGTYSKSLDQVGPEVQPTLVGQTIRVEGNLVPGTLIVRDSPCEFRFRVRQGASEVAVHFPHCTIPDEMRDGSKTDVLVMARGRFEGDGTFAADEVSTKCPSRYVPDENKRSAIEW